MKSNSVLFCAALMVVLFSCKKQEEAKINSNLARAQLTLDSLYACYGVADSPLLRENYPFDDKYSASYLATAEVSDIPNQYSYLWPYSGTFSAVNVLLEVTGDSKYKDLLDTKVLPGLEMYFDNVRTPAGYASYINTASQSDRFYDDNVWLGIDFTDIYIVTKQQSYLDKAKMIWNFVMSGADDQLGGCIYWCEQKKESKNTCSNAPGSVFALKLFQATGDSMYFMQGKQLYDWTKAHLQDATDYLYFDNIRLDGSIGEAKYAYNSGQMMQAAALLYKLTKDEVYLHESQEIAKSCYRYFFADFKSPDGESFRVVKPGDVWFTAVMMRGFIELYNIDKDKIFINAFRQNLDYTWSHTRDNKGLFEKDFRGEIKDDTKWLLTQAAMVEMYARMAMIKDKL